ncbi:prepilin peptidase [candidate division KSB1 bacterium]|nr:MAG: prepilin peptidase [candidate division KSB1 bacterium]
MIETPWGPFPIWLVYTPVVILGAALGSFANVLIYRLPREESIVSPSSRCPKCGRPIRPWENIPVLSWIILRGKCAGCKQSISIRYPLVELVCCCLAVFGVSWFGFNYSGFAYSMLFISLFTLIIIDLEHWLLPFMITIPMTIIGLVGAVFFDLRGIWDCLFGMAAGFALFMALLLGGKALFKRDAMGGGDVVFGIMAGAFLGWKLTILMIFLASLLGTLMAIPILIAGRDISGRAIPFGPFLAVAMVICIFVGDYILKWYTGLIGL